jgi:hypothetical protein
MQSVQSYKRRTVSEKRKQSIKGSSEERKQEVQCSEAALSEDSNRQRSSKKRGGLVGSHRLGRKIYQLEVL